MEGAGAWRPLGSRGVGEGEASERMLAAFCLRMVDAASSSKSGGAIIGKGFSENGRGWCLRR